MATHAHKVPPRVCSECPTLLTGKRPDTKTCSSTCRAARARRLKRRDKDKTAAASAARAMPDHQKQVREMVDGDLQEVAHEVAAEELRPIVREAITEDVTRAIAQMVALVPDVVEKMALDVVSDDPNIRQKAHTLVLRYTLGNPAATGLDDQAGAGITVNFAMPRPDSPGGVSQDDSVPAAAVELRECLVCETEKPSDEFVGNSDRCLVCHEKMLDGASHLLEAPDAD